MKRLKYLLVIITMFFISGCTDVVKENNSNIVVTSYPIEYITNYLYGDYSNINSIYFLFLYIPLHKDKHH